jgi:hypothetical protein
MSPIEAVWGDDSSRFDHYVLRSASAAVRILLPLSDDDTGALITWHEALQEHRSDIELDGYVSWPLIAEYPGDGSRTPPRRYSRAAGPLPQQVTDVLLRILDDEQAGRSQWLSRPDPVTEGRAVALQPPALTQAGTPPASALDGGVQWISRPSSLRTLTTRWSTAGFSGHAWSQDQRVGIAAPPYADSLIVSGPAEVVTDLIDSELEAFPVARSAHLPDMAD